MPRLLARFVTTHAFDSAAIRWVIDFPYSHVEWVLDDDWAPYIASAAPLGQPSSPLPSMNSLTLGAHISGGIRLRPHDYDTFIAVENVYLDVTVEQKHAVMAYAVEQIGTPYDIVNIAGILFHQNWAVNHHAICSVFVTDCTVNNNICLVRIPNLDRPSITPRDVYMSPLWHVLNSVGVHRQRPQHALS